MSNPNPTYSMMDLLAACAALAEKHGLADQWADLQRAQSLGALLLEVWHRPEIIELVLEKHGDCETSAVTSGAACTVLGWCKRRDVVEAVRGCAFALREEDHG